MIGKRLLQKYDSEEDEIDIGAQIKKRRRIIVDDSSDSETENKHPNNDSLTLNESKKVKSDKSIGLSKSLAGLENFEYVEGKNEQKDVVDSPEPPKKKQKTKEIPETQEGTVWDHEKLDFLKPEHIRDGNKRRRGHSEYDSRTLYVPPDFFNGLTPAMNQWWRLKADHFDCIIFFKVGKFYELYHMDAVVGVQELKFTFMKGHFAHSGFPEQAYDKMATQLIEKGYKVARVEQTETPDMMSERVKSLKKATKFDKVSRREICQISELGTQVYTQQTALPDKPETRLLFALNETIEGNCSRYGIAFVDTSICDFYLAEFQDDQHSSRLLTLLAHYNPILVLFERNGLSQKTTTILRTVLRNSKREGLAKDTQMLSPDKALKELKEHYNNRDRPFPESLKALQKSDDSLGLTPNDDSKLMLKSLGGILWYMQQSFIHIQVLDTGRYMFYIPPDLNKKEKINPAIVKSNNSQRHMVLDAITLHNLRVVGEEFSLYRTLDYCCTKFGKRLLHDWLCVPSADKETITSRQAAVKELLSNSQILQEVRLLLAKLPDLERLVAVLHGFGNQKTGHPDTRAVLYCNQDYNKKKINDFVTTLNGFDALMELPEVCSKIESTLLINLTQLKPVGNFPDMKSSLKYFKDTFNFTDALKEGVLAPEKGDDEEFDIIGEKIKSLNKELSHYLKEQEKHFGCKLSFFGSDKKRFQIEVPEANTKKAGNQYQLESSKKGKQPCKRYYTTETKEFLKRMIQLEDQRKAVMLDFARRIFAKFSNEYEMWKFCIQLVAQLDVLASLAEYARNQDKVCTPEIIDNDSPVIILKESFHPCFAVSGEFIPNGIDLGGSKPPLALLTGPNMGGKSTLMRQVGLLTVMVQIVSHYKNLIFFCSFQ